MNTTTQRRNKQARVATVSAPAIAEPPAETPPTRPDIQPCANEGLHRTITGIVTERPPGGRGVVGGGEARAVRALADGQGLDLKRSFAYSNGDEDVPPLDGRQPGGGPPGVDCARGAARRVAGASVRGTPGDAGAAELAAPRFTAECSGAWDPAGVGLLRHSRRQRVDIGGEVGADLGLALAGIDVRACRARITLSARRRVRINRREQARPDPDHEVVAGRVHGRGEEGGCERWVPEIRFCRDLGFRWRCT